MNSFTGKVCVRTAPTEYPLWICGTQVTSANAADLTKIRSADPSDPTQITGVSQMEDTSSCSASYDPATNTLKLNNVLIENRTDNAPGALYAVNYRGADDFTIEAEGENIIQVNAVSYGDSCGLVIGLPDGWPSSTDPKPNVTVTVADGGSLRCNGGTAYNNNGSYGILNREEGKLTINGAGTLTASGSLGTESVYAICSMGDLAISGGTVNVNINEPRGTCVGIDSAKSIEITGGSVTAMVKSTPNNASYGIYANDAITISGGTVEAAGSTRALSKAPTLTGVTAGGSANLDGTGAVAYVAEDNDSYKWFTTPFTDPNIDAYIYLYDSAKHEPDVGGTVIFEGTSYSNRFEFKKPAGTSVTLTAIPDEGNTFVAWRSGGTGGDFLSDSTEYTFKIENTPGGIGIWAVFAKAYTLSFDGNGGTGTMADKTVPAGGYPLPDNGFTAPSGQTFDKWSIDGKTYAAGAVYTVEKDTTVIATWKDVPAPSSGGSSTYKVDVPTDTENATVDVSPKNAAKNATVTVTITPDEGYKVDSVTVTDSKGNEVEVTDNGDGTYSFKMPASKVTVTPVIIEDEPVPLAGRPFVDVPEGSWFYDAAYHCYDSGYFQGVDDTHFDPQGTMTRAIVRHRPLPHRRGAGGHRGESLYRCGGRCLVHRRRGLGRGRGDHQRLRRRALRHQRPRDPGADGRDPLSLYPDPGTGLYGKLDVPAGLHRRGPGIAVGR